MDSLTWDRVEEVIEDRSASELKALLKKHRKLLKKNGPSLMSFAAENNKCEMLAVLAAAGVDVNEPYLFGTPISVAAEADAAEAVRWLANHGADINATSEHATPPLICACQNGNIELLKLLLKRGANINVQWGNPPKNALRVAELSGQTKVVKLLKSKGLADKPKPKVNSAAFMKRETNKPAEWFDAKWVHVYDHATQNGFRSLNEKNRVLFIVGYLIDQLVNGGWSSVYENPSAEFTPMMPTALEQIGAIQSAEVLTKINALFPNGKPAASDVVRMKQIKKLPKNAEKFGKELERLFDECKSKRGERVLLWQLFNFYHK